MTSSESQRPSRRPALHPLLTICLVTLVAMARADAVLADLHDDVTIQGLDARGMDLLLRPTWDIRTVAPGEAPLVRAAHCADADRPRRLLRLALPPGARPSVDVVHVASRTAEGPLPDAGFDGANPQPALSWSIDPWGDLQVLTLVVDLVRVNGPRLELVEELGLRIDYGGGGAGFATRLSALELETGLLNPGQAAGWARPRLAARDGSPPWDGTDWLRIPVSTEGLYQITPELLSQAGLVPAQLDPRVMKLYGFGGRMVDEHPAAARNMEFSPREIPLVREQDGDGSFESGERIIFHGRGTSGLVPGSDGSMGVQDHFYADVNVYWLLVGGVTPGREMDAIADPSGATPLPLSAVRWRGLLNENKAYGETSARACSGDQFRAGSRATYSFPAPLSGVTNLRLEYDFYPDFIMSSDFLGFEVNDQLLPVQGHPHSTRIEGALPLGGDQLRITVERLTDTGLPILLNWLMPSFEAPARFVEDQIAFELPDVPGSYSVQIQQAPASFWIVDVTDYDSLRVTRQTQLVDRVKALSPESTTGRVRRYFGATAAALRTPTGVSLALMPDLKAGAGSAELIVMAPAAFAEAAAELVAVRNAGGVSARLAILEDVYAEFNAGVPDPGAVRNFLRHEWLNADQPARYVLFVGNGHYDYRGLVAGGMPVRMPAWYLYSSSSSDADPMIDDWYVQLETPQRLDMALGRLPANTAAEVVAYVRKLADYAAGADRGPWRNRLLFVGDDEHGLNNAVNSFEMTHSQDTEELVTTRVPDEFDAERLFLFEFPSVYNPAIRVMEKPLAEARLVNRLNEGTALVNFMGHGNNTTWTHEYVFNAARHMPLLQANGRPSIYIAATCSWAEIDLPIGEAFPQQLINMSGGGAIGVLAATRTTGGFSNNNFADDFFTVLFSRDPLTGRYPALGEAVRLAKNELYDSNRRKYVWLGDPSLQPGFPVGDGALIGMHSGGVPSDTLFSQSLAAVETGTRAENPEDLVLGGVADVNMRQASFTRRHNYDPYSSGGVYHGIFLDYQSPGASIFAGSVDLNEGRTLTRFVVPADITEGVRPGELRLYYQGLTAFQESRDGLVFVQPHLARNPNPGSDATPPTLRLYLNGPQWRPDDWVAPNSRIVLEISDSSGVNLTSGIGHRIEVGIDGGTPQDLTTSFEYERGSWTVGRARLDLPLLEPGEHQLRARAFDNFNNPGYAETTFRVLDQETPRLAEVVNFPNPVSERTRFTFQLLGVQLSTPSECEVQVFTVKGRRVARERLSLAGQGGFLWSEDWRPRNDRGEALARGVYLYQVSLDLPDLVYSLVDENGNYLVRRQRAATAKATGKMIVK